jgi:hypothetical protein
MRRALCVLVIALSATFVGVHMLAPAPRHVEGAPCRIVDVITTKTGDVYYVDGTRVPDEGTVLEYLRRGAFPRRECLRLFVPSSVKIQDVEDMRALCGIRQCTEFHAYLYEDRDRETVSEILYGMPVSPDKVRSGPQGAVPWPDRPPERK